MVGRPVLTQTPIWRSISVGVGRVGPGRFIEVARVTDCGGFMVLLPVSRRGRRTRWRGQGRSVLLRQILLIDQGTLCRCGRTRERGRVGRRKFTG